MIVGATAASDAAILHASTELYSDQRLRRVYYSAFSPIPDSSAALPSVSPPLVREHRLYQADWLMRFYGFGARELTTPDTPNLDLAIDPKLAWALRNRGSFPLDLNRASRAELLRIPGIGVRSVERILKARRWRRIRLEDLSRLRVSLARALPFVVVDDHTPSSLRLDALDLRERIAPARQLDMFSLERSALTGQL
jgi:predicted DNA-binding helix-hairpin-helix protein